MAISGSVAVVGSSRDDKGAGNAGSVAVFNLGSAAPEIPVLLIDNPSPNSTDYFGGAVAVSGDIVAVSAKQDDAGRDECGTVLSLQHAAPLPGTPMRVIPNPAPQTQEEFGNSLANVGGSSCGRRFEEQYRS